MTNTNERRNRRPTSITIQTPSLTMREIVATDPDGVYARARVARFVTEQNAS